MIKTNVNPMMEKVDATEILSRQEEKFICSLSPEDREHISNIILKCTKKENEKCVDAIMYHKRFYTNTVEEIARTVRERYE